jgi:hypothetical protein
MPWEPVEYLERAEAAEDRRAGDPAADLRPALSQFRRIAETLIMMLALPFALVGGLWLSGGWVST